jgi:hypothetical protein
MAQPFPGVALKPTYRPGAGLIRNLELKKALPGPSLKNNQGTTSGVIM